MRYRSLILMFAAGLAFAAPLVFAQQFSSVEERMSSADFKAAGLDKLSPQELGRLNAFIRNEVDRRAVQAQQQVVGEQERAEAGRIGFHDYQGERNEIVSRAPGAFTGWELGTTFTLENGQVWRVIEADFPLEGVRLTNPEIHITPGLFGSWNLTVEGYHKSAKVERVK
ncbi:MAG TPA: hypothetical protein VGT79_09560 [Xanthomonadaceae bacterium]|nr:hypothetical protein [Xanthomonadaceae bacterium]